MTEEKATHVRVTVHEALDLPPKEHCHGVYVSTALSKAERYDTSSRKNVSRRVQWEEQCDFCLSSFDEKHKDITLKVYGRMRFGYSKLLGQAVLSVAHRDHRFKTVEVYALRSKLDGKVDDKPRGKLKISVKFVHKPPDSSTAARQSNPLISVSSIVK